MKYRTTSYLHQLCRARPFPARPCPVCVLVQRIRGQARGFIDMKNRSVNGYDNAPVDVWSRLSFYRLVSLILKRTNSLLDLLVLFLVILQRQHQMQRISLEDNIQVISLLSLKIISGDNQVIWSKERVFLPLHILYWLVLNTGPVFEFQSMKR